MASGMNWGIMSLLGVIVLVLGAVASFFIYLAKRSAKLAPATSTPDPAILPQPESVPTT
jgi:hypothetical protein